MREEIREREEEDDERCALWRVILQLYGKKLSCIDWLKYGQGRLLADSREPYVARTSRNNRAIQPKDKVFDVRAL